MKNCQYCQKEVPDHAAKCKHCGGWFENNADIKQKTMDQEERVEKLLTDKKDKVGADHAGDTQYFSVPKKKLVILCLISFGIYEIYWFYKNWKEIKLQEGKKLSPFWRAVFSILFCYNLFKRIIVSAKEKGFKPKMAHGELTVIYIVLVMLYKLPDPFWLLSCLSFIPLVYVADAIRFNNEKINPAFAESHKWSGKEIIFALFGALLWLGTIYDFLYPVEAFPYPV